MVAELLKHLTPSHTKCQVLWCSPTDLHKYRLVRCGALREQDRSSCMSVAALAPEVGWTVADACAAPGNKTTQAASYVGETGAVLACERDPRRFEILQVHAALSGSFTSPMRVV